MAFGCIALLEKEKDPALSAADSNETLKADLMTRRKYFQINHSISTLKRFAIFFLEKLLQIISNLQS